MKNIFTDKNIKVIAIILVITTIGLIGFGGYNEYAYRKIGNCITEGNFNLAEEYIETISPSYKDLEKVRTLLLAISNYNDENDLERTLSRLISLKGFKNDEINYFYNNFLLNINNQINQINFNSAIQALSATSTTATMQTEPSTFSETSTEMISENYSVEGSTEAVTYNEATTENITYTTEGATSYYTSSEATTQHTTEEITSAEFNQSATVYYVESGEVYHITSSCSTLKKSKNVLSGPIPEGRRVCKVCGN